MTKEGVAIVTYSGINTELVQVESDGGEKIYINAKDFREKIKQDIRGGVLRVYDSAGKPRFIEGTVEPLCAYIKNPWVA